MTFMVEGMPEERVRVLGAALPVAARGEMETARTMRAAAAGIARRDALKCRFPVGTAAVSRLIMRITSVSRVAGGDGAGSSLVSLEISLNME